jgi:hypothetical protein
MLYTLQGLSMKVHHYRCFEKPFTSLTVMLKVWTIVFKKIFFMPWKSRRTWGVCRGVKTLSTTNLHTEPPYQFDDSSTLIGVKSRVFVYGYIQKSRKRPLCHYSLKKRVPLLCLNLNYSYTCSCCERAHEQWSPDFILPTPQITQKVWIQKVLFGCAYHRKCY